MWFKLCVLLVLILDCSNCAKNKNNRNPAKKIKLVKGVEFSYIARGALLKLLSAYEQQLNNSITFVPGFPALNPYLMRLSRLPPRRCLLLIISSTPETTCMKFGTEVLAPDPPFWTKTSWLQLGYGIWVNMTVMGIGLSFGFPAVTIPQLREKESAIQITLSDEAWIASILTLSSPIGSLLCGILMDRYGRKIVLILCEIPMCFGWFYTGFARTAKDIIIGRVIAGVGLGMAITAPRAYITEITLPNMRGAIGALPNLFISLGLTFQAGLGSFLKWSTLCYICGSYSFIMMIANIFLPDTPYYLLLKATKSNARANLRKFRSAKFNVEAELEALQEFRKENNIRSLSLKDQIKALFKPSSCKPYGIATIYIIFMQLAGVNVVIMWAVEMLNLSPAIIETQELQPVFITYLETANSSFDANVGNFLLALTRIVFGILTSALLFKVGRRVMAMVSAIGVGVVALGLCAFLYMNNEKSLFPLFIFMAYIAFATLGYYTLPFLMMFELLPLQVRGLMSGICISQLNLLMFGMNNCYPSLRESFGLANTMAMFGVFSLLGALILFFILPETKDLTLQEIEEFFNSRRSTLVSQRRVMSDQLNDASRISVSGQSSMNVRRSTDRDKKPRDSKGKTLDKTDENPKYKVQSDTHSKDEDNASKKKEQDSKNKVNTQDFIQSDPNYKNLNGQDSKLSTNIEKDTKDKVKTRDNIEKDLKYEDQKDKDSKIIEKDSKDKIKLHDNKKTELQYEDQNNKHSDEKEKDFKDNENSSKDRDSKGKDSIGSKDSKDSKDEESRKHVKSPGVIFKNIDD